ncbi:hypothetical protein D3C81_1899230 [compost metagenome]
MCISTGASVPGVIWNTIFTPSRVSSWPVFSISSVGWIRVVLPVDTVTPIPALTPPCGLRGSKAPNMYTARRAMALPAITFSLTASSLKSLGATMRTLPALTSASSTMPRTPPK